jgi:hypothetical protein
MKPQDPKYQQKSKAIPSAEPTYFVHFAMRHPVLGNKSQKKVWIVLKNVRFTTILRHQVKAILRLNLHGF